MAKVEEEVLKPHPLEGKYVVYNFGMLDDSGEGWSFRLYQIVDNSFVDVFHPLDTINPLCAEAACLGSDTDETFIKLLKENGITELFSVSGEMLNSPPRGFENLDIDNVQKGGEIEQWQEHQPLDGSSLSCPEIEERLVLLQEAGIKIRFWDAKTNKEYNLDD